MFLTNISGYTVSLLDEDAWETVKMAIPLLNM